MHVCQRGKERPAIAPQCESSFLPAPLSLVRYHLSLLAFLLALVA
jgi:hypothetical protein